MNWRTIWTGWNAYVERMRRLPTRRERRLWVSALFLGMAAADALIFAFEAPAGTLSLWGSAGHFLGFLSILFCWCRLMCWSIPVIPPPAAWPDTLIDERQKAMRDRSFRRAYQMVFFLCLIAAVAAYVFQEDLPGCLKRIEQSNLMPLVLSQIVLLVATLPIACLAWTEPDETDWQSARETQAEEGSAAGSY